MTNMSSNFQARVLRIGATAALACSRGQGTSITMNPDSKKIGVCVIGSDREKMSHARNFVCLIAHVDPAAPTQIRLGRHDSGDATQAGG